jgi:hypothetical protein
LISTDIRQIPPHLALPIFKISVIREINGKAFPDFAQDSRRFNLAFTISRYNFSIDSRNAD